MYLKSKINVTCSVSTEAIPYTGILLGKIISTDLKDLENGVTVGIEYCKGNGTNQPILSKPKSLTNDEVNAFYEAIKNTLPPFTTYMKHEAWVYYTAFKIEMANTYGISPNDIDIIDAPFTDELIKE
jgi:hypothetical protein